MEEFKVDEFLKYYLTNIIIVILFSIVGVLVGYYYTRYVQVPIYKSQAKLVLTSSNRHEITQSDISINKNLVSTYREIIKSRRILKPVIDKLELDISVDDLNDKIKVTSADDTEIIIVTVYDENREKSRDIANEIATIFKDDIGNLIPIDNVVLYEQAIAEKKPYNVHPIKQYIMFGGGAMLLATLIISVAFYYDDSIKSGEDIEKKVGLTVLTTVPKSGKKKKRKK